MVDLSAPQPRLAPALFPNRPLPRSHSHRRPLVVVDDTFYSLPKPRALRSPQPLLSPYVLPEDAGLHKLSSKPPCSPTKRRRAPSRNLSRSARHRYSARSDCCINTFPRPLTSLDDLPWISAMSIEPDSSNPWDIADLSLLDTSEEEDSSGPGPVRRRKTSLRSNPLAKPSPKDDEPLQLPVPFLHYDPWSDLEPQTPLPRKQFVPSDVTFHGLNPLFPWEEIEVPSRPNDIETPH